jgi:hypothetical protein
VVNRGIAFLTIKVAAISQSDKRRMRIRVAVLERKSTPICEERTLSKIYTTCSQIQALARRHLHRRESIETCLGLLFVSGLAAVGAALPMI